MARADSTVDLIDAFSDTLRVESRLSENTVEVYLAEASRFLRFLDDRNVDVGVAGTADVVDYLLDRQADGVDPRTIAKLLSAIRALYRFLVQEERATSSPADLIDTPRIGRRLPEVFSPDEVDRMLGVIDVATPLGLRDRFLFELIYSCGLRVSEAASLDTGSLYLREGFVRVIGKGDKERLVPLGGAARSRAEAYLEGGRPQLVRKPMESALFLNQRGDRLSRKGMWKKFKDISRSAGLEGKIHTLRHSFATHLLAGGADLRAVQELLGHADVTTTQIYTHVESEELKRTHTAHHPRGRRIHG